MTIPETLNSFTQEFTSLNYVLKNAQKILIVAHTRPDPDAVGSTIALKQFIEKYYNADVDAASFSPFPIFLQPLFPGEKFLIADHIDLSSYDVAIGCDSVDRGFDQVVPRLNNDCVTIAIDHHHDITLETDISIIDAGYASTTEILYNFFTSQHLPITKSIAQSLLTGIIGDTGIFQHANTSPHVLSVSADLVRAGASVNDIVQASFTNKKIETLNLWGKALERAQFYKETGLVVTALTWSDTGSKAPTAEEIKEVASILATAPGVKVALIIFQVSHTHIKASMRAKENAHVDVSAIAHRFGGGGHPLAAGFEMRGRIKTNKAGEWHVV